MVGLIRGAGLAAFVACFAVSAALGGCSSGAEVSDSEGEGTGSIGLNLQVGGATLAQVSYTIVGPNEYVKIKSQRRQKAVHVGCHQRADPKIQ